MKAWSVAVNTQSPHGMGLSTCFTLAETRADAVAAGVRTALTAHGEGCPATIVGAVAYEIDPTVICAAADEWRAAQHIDEAAG